VREGRREEAVGVGKPPAKPEPAAPLRLRGREDDLCRPFACEVKLLNLGAAYGTERLRPGSETPVASGTGRGVTADETP